MASFAMINDVSVHYRFVPGSGMPIVFLNSLGTDFRIWDDVITQLPPGVPVLCLDKRGHGLSDDGPVTMDQLVEDVAALMDHVGLASALVCGVSVGGMIAQGLAAARPDLVVRLVLCCTGARIGDIEAWNARIDTVLRSGIEPLADPILERWFSGHFRTARSADLAGYRNMLVRTSSRGYAAVCEAIRDTDLSEVSGSLGQPALCIAGSDDLATSPDLVRRLTSLIPNARFSMIEQCAHLPSIEAPEAVAEAILDMRELFRDC